MRRPEHRISSFTKKKLRQKKKEEKKSIQGKKGE